MILNLRKLLIFFTLFIFLIISFSTELLSIFDLLNSQSIKIFWFLILITVAVIIKKKNLIKRNANLFKKDKKEFYFVTFILIGTLITALIYPPNTLDSLSYHLTKVLHWEQNQNLNFYPTNDLRELILAPLTEFAFLHLYLLTGNDYLFNLVQWYSMFVTCLTISLISSELNCNYKYQLFSILFCITIPIGILQSSGTQNDYVTTMWLTIMTYCILKFLKSNKNNLLYLFGLSTSVGLGILTKGTFYFFAFPFCIWIGLNLLLKPMNKKYFLIILIPLIILLINAGHFYRNINLYGNPLGLSNESDKWNNKIVNYKTFSSNVIKNLSLNLSVPNENMNKQTLKLINEIHKFIGIDSGDPKTSTGGRGFYIPFSIYENSAPGTLHFFIIILVMFYIRFKKENYIKYYLVSIVFGFLLFCLLVKWMPQNNRILLCVFVLFAPLVSYTLQLSKLKKLTNIFSIILFLYSLPYVLFNKTRPLLANISIKEKTFHKPDYLIFSRDQLYYSADKIYNKRNLYPIYLNAIKNIKQNNCKFIGFNDRGSYLDYPFWIMLKKEMGNNRFYWTNLEVKNKSNTKLTKIKIPILENCKVFLNY